jgi:hypothetical protein
VKRKILIAVAMLSPGYLLVRLATNGWVTLADVMIVVTIIILVIAMLARRSLT